MVSLASSSGDRDGPLSPSVCILVLWKTCFTIIAEASSELGSSSLLCLILSGGGAWIFLFMSFKVMSPLKLHGLITSNGKAKAVLTFFDPIMFLPAVEQMNTCFSVQMTGYIT
jgi:hypothetical protein